MSANASRREFMTAVAAAAAMPLIGTPGAAQEGWPTKPIRIIAGFPAGGQTDLFARTFGDVISKKLNHTIVVENKAGAGGTVAAVELKRSAPDGHTWLFTISTTIIMNRLLVKNVPYDADNDFILVSIMPNGNLPLVVSSKTGATNLKEFVDYCRRAEKVSIGSYARGSVAHLVIAELNKQYGLNIEPIHYRGEAPMWTDVAGQVLDGAVGTYGSAQSVLQSGQARAIAIPRRRHPLLPEVATFQEQGAHSKLFELTGFQCCSVPTGTPPAIVKRISELLIEAGQSDKVQAMMRTFAIDEAPMTLEATQKLYNAEKPIWLDLVKSLGIEPD